MKWDWTDALNLWKRTEVYITDKNEGEYIVSLMIRLSIALVLSLLCISGCSRESVSVENIKLFAAVRTAVSMESPQQIERCRSLMETESSAGRLPRKLAEELGQILAMADEKKWKDAETKIIRLQEHCKPESTECCEHVH